MVEICERFEHGISMANANAGKCTGTPSNAKGTHCVRARKRYRMAIFMHNVSGVASRSSSHKLQRAVLVDARNYHHLLVVITYEAFHSPLPIAIQIHFSSFSLTRDISLNSRYTISCHGNGCLGSIKSRMEQELNKKNCL